MDRFTLTTRKSQATTRQGQSEWRGTDNATGQVVSMKLVDVSRSESENDVVRKEAEAQQLLSAVNEKRIVSLKAFFRNDQNQFVLVTEETVGTLQQLIEANHSFTEHEVKVIAFGALEALLTVHNNYHIHRNIHPSSFFFTSNDLNSLKLGNFACVTDENGFNSASGLKGIEGFRAPEITKTSRYGRPVDIYSLGETLLRLLPPIYTLPPLTQSFISPLLSEPPSGRPTALQCLQHPWLSDTGPHTSAPFSLTPAIKVNPEPVPDFPGWIKLVPTNGNSPYYFHQDSGTVQYEHPGGRQYVIDQIQKTQEAGATGWEKLARSVTTSKNGRVPDNDDEDGEVRIAPAKLKEAAMNLVRGLTKKR